MLWLNDYSILTDEGEALIDIRRSFLSEPAIRGAYGAYAKAQADRLVRRNEEGKEGFSSDTKSRTEKHGRHCMRLLLQGTQLLATGTMTVDVSYYREFLFDMGELAGNDPQGFYDQYKIHADRFDRTETKLPQFPDRLTADDDLVNIRLQMSHHG
jgi:hypothetical protein